MRRNMATFCFFIIVLLAQTKAIFLGPKYLKFASCLSPDEHNSEYASIDSVRVLPNPVVLPGNFTVGGHVLIKKDITSHGLKMNLEIYKILLGQRTKIPCVANLGSCFYDLCDLMGNTNGSFFIHDCVITELIGLGVPCKCPITAGSYTLSLHLFTVPSPIWLWLASGDYHFHVEFIDTNAGNHKAACFDINLPMTHLEPAFG